MDLTSATVIAHSVWGGTELVTFHLTFPRFILAEFNTHRAFSRNSASSRAIPIQKMLAAVMETPFVPQEWPKNRTGMSALELVPELQATRARQEWLYARDAAVERVRFLHNYAGVHKQIANRLLEPFMWHTVIMSTTMPGLENFFAQRDHPDAQPEMQTLARKMREALSTSAPVETQWHIPFDDEFSSVWNLESSMIRAISMCARVSYGRELEERSFEQDMALVVRLARDNHWSPFEHVAFAGTNPALTDWDGDGAGWGIPYGEYYGQRHLGNFEAPWAQARHHWRQLLPSIAAELDALS